MKRLWIILFVIPLFAQETEKEDSFIQTMEEKLYLSSVLKMALEKCHPMDLDNINELLNELNPEDKD